MNSVSVKYSLAIIPSLFFVTACGGGGGGGGLSSSSAALASQVELSVTVEENSLPSEHTVGDVIKMGMKVNNQSIGIAEDVQLSLPIPSNMRYVGGLSQCGIDTVNGNRTLNCDLGNLSDTEEVTLEIPVRLVESGSTTITANVSANQIDTDISNNFNRLEWEIQDCNACEADRTITISWQPNTDDVIGYNIYYGATDASTTQWISASSSNDPTQTTINAWDDLKLIRGEDACFAIRAYNASGESLPSEIVCGQIS